MRKSGVAARFAGPFGVSFAALCLLAPGKGDGLTVYRIGAGYSAGDPAPEGVDVVQLSWADASTGFGGGWKVLDMEESRIAPVFLEPGRNISLDAAGLGGGAFGAKSPVKTHNEFHDWTVDGDPDTAFEEAHYLETRESPFIGVDLGGILPINRVVFYPRPEKLDRFVGHFQLYLFDGDLALLRDPLGSLRHYDLVAQEEDNRDARVEVILPTRLVHTVMMSVGNQRGRSGGAGGVAGVTRSWQIAEFEIYGDGYAPNASYRTGVLDLGSIASLGQISWQGSEDRGARVEIHTRNGSDDDPNRYWRRTGRGTEVSYRDPQGRPLTRQQYEDLLLTEQGGTSHDQDNWSFWSAPYAFGDSAGTPVSAPLPERYLQLDVQFKGTRFASGELSYLEFEATSPPVVRRVVGEVSPTEVVAGEETEFVFAFLPTITEAEPGFDRFVLSTPGELIAVDSVRVNSEKVEYRTGDQPLPGHRVELVLPRMEAADSGRPVEVFFRARVFRFGTVFEGELHDSRRPGEVGQGVVDGDAIFRLDSNRLSVGVNLSGDLLQDVEVTSPVVTPNGDGVNDEVGFRYKLLQLAEGQEVTVDIYDLGGRLVRRVYEGLDGSGGHERGWDGRGDSGALAPGVYLYRITVDADSRRAGRSGVVSIAY